MRVNPTARICCWRFFTPIIVSLGFLMVGKISAQQTGPNVDQCSSGIVDSNTGVEQTVCLSGDSSGLDGYVEVDDWGGGNSYYSADSVGASGYLDSSSLSDQCCSSSETTNGSITPNLNTWYSLTGYYDEDVCDEYYNCNWQYGNYGLSVSVEVTGTPPSAPTSLTASPGNGQVALSWSSSSGATSYNLYMGTSSGGEGSTPVATGISGTSYLESGVSNGTTYYFEVAAVSSDGTSALSNEASATPVAGPPPAPSGLTATPGNGLVALQWTASSGAASYNVYLGTSPGAESSSPSATGITGTAYASSGLSDGTAYYFKVAAVNSGGTSGYSNEANATPTSALPSGYSYSATYDAVGNVGSYNDSVMGSWTFGYDALNRLTTAQNVAITGPSAQFEGYYGCWGYDNFGNRLYESMSTTACNNNPPLTQWSTYTATNTNRVDADSYDAAGDVINDGSYKYLYDPEGRVCAVWNLTFGTATGYIYDAEGNRVAKGTITNWGSCDPTVNGVASHLTQIDALGVSNEQFTETDGNGNWQHTNVWAAAKVLATYDASGLHFYMDDPLGSRRVQASYTGATEQDCLSSAYGDFESCEPTPTEHLFTGKERDAESGNDYFGARYYASTMGRYLSPDWSAKQEPVPYAKLDDPQTLNLYSYVNNNPLSRFDNDGHEQITIQMRAYIPQSSVLGYKGDNRGPTTSQTVTSRTSITLTIETDPSISQNPLVGTPVSTAGQSENLLTGNTATQTVGLPTATVTRDSNGNVVVNVQQDAANPLTPAGVTPAIKSDLNITVPTNGSSVTAAGTVSGSPAFEMNVTPAGGATTNVPLQGASSNPAAFAAGLTQTNHILNSTPLPPPPPACGSVAGAPCH